MHKNSVHKTKYKTENFSLEQSARQTTQNVHRKFNSKLLHRSEREKNMYITSLYKTNFSRSSNIQKKQITQTAKSS
jgi:CRISPR/Cas system-associated protein Cas5 (RAMP superfamily)